MKRIFQGVLSLAVLVSLVGLGLAQPSIPKDKIPADLPSQIKTAVEGLYSTDATKRAEAAMRLGEMGDLSKPAIPFLVGLLGDDQGVDLQVPGADIANSTSPGIEAAVAAGVRAVVQPGGSIRDEAVIEVANQLGVAMVFTGIRHFKH